MNATHDGVVSSPMLFGSTRTYARVIFIQNGFIESDLLRCIIEDGDAAVGRAEIDADDGGILWSEGSHDERMLSKLLCQPRSTQLMAHNSWFVRLRGTAR